MYTRNICVDAPSLLIEQNEKHSLFMPFLGNQALELDAFVRSPSKVRQAKLCFGPERRIRDEPKSRQNRTQHLCTYRQYLPSCRSNGGSKRGVHSPTVGRPLAGSLDRVWRVCAAGWLHNQITSLE